MKLRSRYIFNFKVHDTFKVSFDTPLNVHDIFKDLFETPFIVQDTLESFVGASNLEALLKSRTHFKF